MGDNTLWYGYLEAGDKGSAVAMDSRLNTGDPTTIYVFNLKRGEILEYKKAIVEPKLRELKASEQELGSELKNAYRKARNGFTPRGARIANIPEKGRPAAAKAAPAAEPVEENGFDDDDGFVDDDGGDDNDES